MIKQEIIDRLAKKHRLSNRYAKELVDSVFELLEDGIKRDGKVTITRFGTFYVGCTNRNLDGICGKGNSSAQRKLLSQNSGQAYRWQNG